MLRVLTATGLTASADLAQPNVEYKWKVIYAQLLLKTGTGSGSRNANLSIVGNGYLFAYPLLASVSSSTASAETGGSGGTAGANPSDGNTSWTAFPEIRAVDQISCGMTLVSGDTVSYYVLVDEVLDE